MQVVVTNYTTNLKIMPDIWTNQTIRDSITDQTIEKFFGTIDRLLSLSNDHQIGLGQQSILNLPKRFVTSF
jgi:hypothetical protein